VHIILECINEFRQAPGSKYAYPGMNAHLADKRQFVGKACQQHMHKQNCVQVHLVDVESRELVYALIVAAEGLGPLITRTFEMVRASPCLPARLAQDTVVRGMRTCTRTFTPTCKVNAYTQILTKSKLTKYAHTHICACMYAHTRAHAGDPGGRCGQQEDQLHQPVPGIPPLQHAQQPAVAAAGEQGETSGTSALHLQRAQPVAALAVAGERGALAVSLYLHFGEQGLLVRLWLAWVRSTGVLGIGRGRLPAHHAR